MAAAGFERPELPGDPERAAAMVRAATYLVVLGVVAGFYWAYAEGFYKGLGFPHNTFLFIPGIHFSDLTYYYSSLRADAPYSRLSSVYPPFGFIVLQPFAWLGGNAAIALWVVVAVGGLAAFVAWELDFVPPIDRAAAVVVLTVVTYPFLFAFDRGNIEVFAVLLLATFVYGLQTDRADLAAIAIGAAAAMEAYPLFFAAFFVAHKRWRQLRIMLGTVLVLTFLGSVYHDFDLWHMLDLWHRQLDFYNSYYTIGDQGLGWGCSLFGALKIVVYALGGTRHAVQIIEPIYIAVTVGLGAGIVVALARLPLRFWEQIALLTLAFVALPATSGDYKLLHILVPMVLFLRYGNIDRWRYWYLVGFAALMVPWAYVLLRPDGTNLGVLIDPLVMLAMGLAIVAAGLTRRHADRLSATTATTPLASG